MDAWINHFAMNLGAALANLFFAIVPPQFTDHTDDDLRDLRDTNFFKAFVLGLIGDRDK